jgi:replication-associated recombination protein RarA
MLSAKFHELLRYPQSWGIAISDRWVSLCNGLRDYEAPCRSLTISKERKWELVSALQKSIRRADKQMAVRLVSAMDTMPEEYAYCWRRLCVIACEDVGPADDVLASFVVACATVFPPKKIAGENYRLICFLAEQMCELSNSQSHLLQLRGD